MNNLEQDIENELLEKKKEIILVAAKLVEGQQNFLRSHFERNLMQSQRSCISELEKRKMKAVEVTIQILYYKSLFDSIEKKDQLFNEYLTFTNQYLWEKGRTERQTSDGVYYLSDLDYSTRPTVLIV